MGEPRRTPGPAFDWLDRPWRLLKECVGFGMGNASPKASVLNLRACDLGSAAEAAIRDGPEFIEGPPSQALGQERQHLCTPPPAAPGRINLRCLCLAPACFHQKPPL